MKASFLILLLVLSSTASAQTWNLDKGEGDAENLRTAFTALDLLERNDPGELLHYFATGHRPDSVLLHSWIARIQDLHPTLKNGSVSPCFCNYGGKGLWYERTYFSMGGTPSEKKYLLQVHIDLEKVDGIVRIVDIHFREKDEMVKWDAELKALDERTEDEPPPPPPPFGLPPR